MRALGILVGALLSAVPTTTWAQGQGCLEHMAAMRVAPVSTDPADSLGDGPLGCSQAQFEMFAANWTAVAQATPVTDLSQVYGTWLGDNVRDYVMGRVVPGQEVLRISAGAEPGDLFIEQFWLKAVVPDQSQALLWDDDARYRGLVAQGTLTQLGQPGAWRSDPFGGGAIGYSGITFEWERSYDIAVMAQLNHFEWELHLRMMGNTLVLDTSVFDQPTRDLMERSQTFTRVDEMAPEVALQIIVLFEVSQAMFHECLTHQISERDGPFVTGLLPHDLAQVIDLVRRAFVVEQGVQSIFALTRETQSITDAQRDQISDLLDVRSRLQAEPLYQQIAALLRSGAASGCPSF